jgi:hypothetical protein
MVLLRGGLEEGAGSHRVRVLACEEKKLTCMERIGHLVRPSSVVLPQRGRSFHPVNQRKISSHALENQIKRICASIYLSLYIYAYIYNAIRTCSLTSQGETQLRGFS